jgi:hypothetical protein
MLHTWVQKFEGKKEEVNKGRKQFSGKSSKWLPEYAGCHVGAKLLIHKRKEDDDRAVHVLHILKFKIYKSNQLITFKMMSKFCYSYIKQYKQIKINKQFKGTFRHSYSPDLTNYNLHE